MRLAGTYGQVDGLVPSAPAGPGRDASPTPHRRGATIVQLDGHLTNVAELRARLAAAGADVPGPDPSAAALVARLYETLGGAGVDRLQGQFALAIQTPSGLLLARDPFGTKPLHYYVPDDRAGLIFASTMSELVSRLDRPLAIDPVRLSDFVVFGRPLGSATLLRGIHTVPPNVVIEVTLVDGRVTLHARTLPPLSPIAEVATVEAAVDAVAALVRESVAGCLSGHARMGVALSGGLDSSVIALFAHDHGRVDLHTFTLRSSSTGDDGEVARRLAGHMGCAHDEVPLTFETYLEAIPSVIQARQAPTAAGITMCLLSRRVARDGEACLAGFGAGDVFGEATYAFSWEIYRSRLVRRIRRALDLGLPVSDEGRAALDAALAADGYAAYYDSAGFADQGVDWIAACGRSHGVEIHMPFCHEPLDAFVHAVPPAIRNGPDRAVNKYLLRELALRTFGDAAQVPARRPKEAMPDAIVAFHRQFADLCEAAVDDEYLRRHAFAPFIGDKASIVLLDLFVALFLDRRPLDDLDVRELLGTTVCEP